MSFEYQDLAQVQFDEEEEPNAQQRELTNRIIGAAIEVHRALGPGYLESFYEDTLAREFDLREILYERQRRFDVFYKGKLIGRGRVDFVVEGRVVVEFKCVDAFAPIHTAPSLSYLKALSLKLALLLNFNSPTLREGIKRIAR